MEAIPFETPAPRAPRMVGPCPGGMENRETLSPRDPQSRGTPVLQDSQAMVDPLRLSPSSGCELLKPGCRQLMQAGMRFAHIPALALCPSDPLRRIPATGGPPRRKQLHMARAAPDSLFSWKDQPGSRKTRNMSAPQMWVQEGGGPPVPSR